MVGPKELYLFDVLYRLEEYLDSDPDDAEQLITALPKEVVEELQRRCLQLLHGNDAREVLELPGYKGGRPTESFRNFFIALEFHVLRNQKKEGYEAAIKILEDRWNLSRSRIKAAIGEFKGDEELQFISQLSRRFGNLDTPMRIAEKFSKLPPVV